MKFLPANRGLRRPPLKNDLPFKEYRPTHGTTSVPPLIIQRVAMEFDDYSGDWRMKPITLRQRMVAKFWGWDIKPSTTRGSFSKRLDAWYAEDPRRQEAWERYKTEWESRRTRRTGRRASHHEDATRRDLERMDRGIGFLYLEESEEEYLDDDPQPSLESRPRIEIYDTRNHFAEAVFAIMLVIGIAFCAYAIIRKYRP